MIRSMILSRKCAFILVILALRGIEYETAWFRPSYTAHSSNDHHNHEMKNEI